MENHDDMVKALIADLEDDAPKYWKRALQIGQDQWREQSSPRVLALVGEEYDGGLLNNGVVEQLLGLLEVDPTAQYVLLAHNKTHDELKIEAGVYDYTPVPLQQFAAPRILAERSVTGRNYTLYIDRCASCLKTDCNFTDCPGNSLTWQA